MIAEKLIPELCGWRPNWRRLAAFLAGQRPFRWAAPHLMQMADPAQDALLWQATQKVTGAHLPAHSQTIGDCVGHGYAAMYDYLECCDIVLRATNESYIPVSHACTYALGREHAGLLGDQDGSYGAAAVWATTHWGICSNTDALDSDTDDTRAKQWGKTGVPPDWKKLAAEHLCGASASITSTAEALASLQAGYPFAICSDQAFSMHRDAQGFCAADNSTQWPHCMACIGYDGANGRFCILQSWGQNTPDGPCYKGQPDNSFWADGQVVNGMLRQGDSFALSKFTGWPGGPVPPPTPPPTPAGATVHLGSVLIPGTYGVVAYPMKIFPRVITTLVADTQAPAGQYDQHSPTLAHVRELLTATTDWTQVDWSAAALFGLAQVARMFPRRPAGAVPPAR